MGTNRFVVEVLRLDVPTVTGRVYHREVIEQALARPELQQQLVEGTFTGGPLNINDLGEANEPWPLANTCFIVRDLRLQDDRLMAAIEFLDTPTGQGLQQLFEAEKLRFLTSGTGRLEQLLDGRGTAVVSDFSIEHVAATVVQEEQP